MSSLPSSGTMLPPTVRYAKIIGTVGSGILARLYHTHSRHTISSLLDSSVPTDKMVKIFKKIEDKANRPILYTLLVSVSSLAYVSYYLYSNLPDQGVSTTTFSSRSFIPTTTTKYPLVYGWVMYGASTVLLAFVVPYSQFTLGKAKGRLLTAAESVEQNEKWKLGVKVVDDGKVQKDLEEWGLKSAFRAGLVGVAIVVAVFVLAG